MRVLESVEELKLWRQSQNRDLEIGFVPTMGALHAGHVSLMEASRKSTDLTVVSIFVNPTQFNDPSDYQNYPITTRQDLEICEKEGVSAVFLPKYKDMLYPDQYRYKLTETEFSTRLCGAHRPGHFDGVLSVVMKLFQLVKPTHAFFGEKDFQQLSLIQGMVEAFFLDLKIVPVPTLREPTGLAMSSRNRRLTPDDLKIAPKLYEVISTEPSLDRARAQLNAIGFRVEYLDEINGRRFVAAKLGEGKNEVRLIDNVKALGVEP